MSALKKCLPLGGGHLKEMSSCNLEASTLKRCYFKGVRFKEVSTFEVSAFKVVQQKFQRRE